MTKLVCAISTWGAWYHKQTSTSRTKGHSRNLAVTKRSRGLFSTNLSTSAEIRLMPCGYWIKEGGKTHRCWWQTTSGPSCRPISVQCEQILTLEMGAQWNMICSTKSISYILIKTTRDIWCANFCKSSTRSKHQQFNSRYEQKTLGLPHNQGDNSGRGSIYSLEPERGVVNYSTNYVFLLKLLILLLL